MRLRTTDLNKKVQELTKEIHEYGAMPMTSAGIQNKMEYEIMAHLQRYSLEARLNHAVELDEQLQEMKGRFGAYLSKKYLRGEDL